MKFLRHHRLGSLTLVLAILLFVLQGCGGKEEVKPEEPMVEGMAEEMAEDADEMTDDVKSGVKSSAAGSFEEMTEKTEDIVDPTEGEAEFESEESEEQVEASSEAPTYTIQFGRGVSYSDPDEKIEEAATYLKENAEAEAEIQGHTDSEGPVGLNQRLSQRRADTIRRALINLEVEGSRLEAVGYGSNNPVSGLEETDPENRRVVIRIK